ncbi:GNAT family N-acetyltransferase [Chlorobium sp. BLA1]|uniref:GNAT family N-acetyltransferase n=1 Tax=Candidatus Chlorobium masyuteum TaxID=2716876 RepID=UPI0014238B31|nr:GNAT family N-acetyltransferase [Candidatus Chlorobium masyuteum]NHQ60659.1 GNAT family N-acetyltransferase [Candidatus Chlorobium masyuteum]
MSHPTFSVEPLNSNHVREGFNSGSEVLDNYFAVQVGQDIRRNITRCFVAIDNISQKIAGYYTLSAAQIPLPGLPEVITRKMPRYHAVTASRIGRLAVDSSYQGKRIGSALIADALLRSSTSSMAVYALLVDAKNEQAEAFYLHHGFIPCIDRLHTLFLPLSTISKI